MSMIIVSLSAEERVELTVKAMLSVQCRLCKAGHREACNVFDGTLEDLLLAANGDYLPVHKVRMEDAMPLYNMYVIAAKEQLRQQAIAHAREKYAGSGRTHSDYYEPAGPEIDVDCHFCDAQPGEECRTVTGSYTKSHRPRRLKYKRMNK